MLKVEGGRQKGKGIRSRRLRISKSHEHGGGQLLRCILSAVRADGGMCMLQAWW